MRPQRTTTKSRTALVASALAASLAVAACGGGDEGDGEASGASDRERIEQATLKHAECLRKNGVDAPDPQPGKGGVIRFGPGEGADRATLERAMKECRRFLDDVPPPQLSEEQRTEMQDRALAHARCLREHGIDVPDPTFDKRGAIIHRLPGSLDPNDPRLRKAEKECAKFGPRGEL